MILATPQLQSHCMLDIQMGPKPFPHRLAKLSVTLASQANAAQHGDAHHTGAAQ